MCNSNNPIQPMSHVLTIKLYRTLCMVCCVFHIKYTKQCQSIIIIISIFFFISALVDYKRMFPMVYVYNSVMIQPYPTFSLKDFWDTLMEHIFTSLPLLHLQYLFLTWMTFWWALKKTYIGPCRCRMEIFQSLSYKESSALESNCNYLGIE